MGTRSEVSPKDSSSSARSIPKEDSTVTRVSLPKTQENLSLNRPRCEDGHTVDNGEYGPCRPNF